MRIAFISLVLSFLSGNITISSFVTAIFAETGSTLSEANSSILIVAVQIFANLLVLNIVDRIDRRVRPDKDCNRSRNHSKTIID